MPEPLTHVGQNPCTQRGFVCRSARVSLVPFCCGIPVKLSGPKALSSSSGYASALVFVYRSGQPFLYHLQPVFIRKPTDHAAVDPPRGRRGSGPRL